MREQIEKIKAYFPFVFLSYLVRKTFCVTLENNVLMILLQKSMT